MKKLTSNHTPFYLVALLLSLATVFANQLLVNQNGNVDRAHAASKTCPFIDGSTWDDDSTADGTITVSTGRIVDTTGFSSSSDYYDCTASDVHITTGSIGLTGDLTTGYFPEMRFGNLEIDSGGIISSTYDGCESLASPDDGYGPNTTTNICTYQTSGYGGGTSASSQYGGGGGAYGGDGGGGDGGTGGPKYGNPYTPELFGSSGGNGGVFGGAGGGVIKINVSGTLTHNGTIDSNGGYGGNDYWNNITSGGGSGGSIYVTTNVLAGSTGVFEAYGGDGDIANGGYESGGGGGGRIALYVSSLSGYTLSASKFDASGGTATGTADSGQDGTVFVQNDAGTSGDSTDDDIYIYYGFDYDDTDWDVDTWTSDTGASRQLCDATASTPSITAATSITFGGRLVCDDSFTSFDLNSSGALTFSDDAFLHTRSDLGFSASSSFSLGTGAWINSALTTGDISFIVPTGSYTWTDVYINTGKEGIIGLSGAISTLSLAGTSSMIGNINWSNVANLTIGSSAVLGASSKGCDGTQGTNEIYGYGPTDPGNACTTTTAGYGTGAIGDLSGAYASGAGHGGAGGTSGSKAEGATYDSTTAPVLMGSSGGTLVDNGSSNVTLSGGHGGGYIILSLSGTLTNNGAISVDGGDGGYSFGNKLSAGGGSGGSIYITTDTYAGTGSISAAGGASIVTSGGYHGGGGGGGIISINYTTDSSGTLSGLTADSVAPGGAGKYNSPDERGAEAGSYTSAQLAGLPLVTNFTTGNGSTDFSSEGDIEAVSGMKLANTLGSVTWGGSVNAGDENYDSYVNIGTGYVSLDATNLDASIDSAATVSLGVDSCTDITLYYATSFYNSLADIKTNGQECNTGTTPACTSISCTSNTVTFDVPHFDGYGGEGASAEGVPTSLTIDNNAPAFDISPADDSDGTTPTDEDNDVTFTGTATDTNGDGYYLLICDSLSTATGHATGGAPSCSGTEYAVSTLTTSGDAITPITTSSSGLSSESYAWIGFVCDDNTPSLCSSSDAGNSPFKVNHVPVIGTVYAGIACGANDSVDPGNSASGTVTTAVGGGTDSAKAVAIQSDGKTVIGGYSYNGSDNDFALARYNVDGSLDTTFSTDGKLVTDFGGNNDQINAVAIQSDGKIVVAGTTNSGAANDFALARYNVDGSLDTTFSGDGVLTTASESGYDLAYAVAIQSDGKIVVGGSGTVPFALMRYTTAGVLDTSFDGDGKATAFTNAKISSILIQSDGKIVAAGDESSGTKGFAVARFNTDGSLDTTFSGDGKVTTIFGSTTTFGESAALQSDGKIVMAGRDNNGNIVLARYTTVGVLDTSFDTDGIVTTLIGEDTGAMAVVIQSDGKIIAAGWSGVGDDWGIGMARYNTDGSLDTSFGTNGLVTVETGSGETNGATSLALQSDGKIVAGGFPGPGSNYDLGLVRYDTDGSVDDLSGYACIQVDVTDTDTDTSNDTIDLHVCSTNSFTGGTCDGTTYCTITETSSGDSVQCIADGIVPIPTDSGSSYAAYIFLVDEHGMTDGGSGGSNTYSVTDIAPSLFGGASDYTATDAPAPSAGGSDTVDFTAVIYDPNGEADITVVEGVFFDDSATTNVCSADETNCYIDSACDISNTAYGTSSELEAACSVTVYFNANASDWDVHVKPKDEQAQVTDQADAGVSLTNIALQGIDIVETGIAYGPVEIGGTSGGVETSMGNVGNVALDVFVDGTLMCTDSPGCAAYTIPIAQQRWFHDSGTFDWDTDHTQNGEGTGPYPMVGTASGTGDVTGCLNRNIAVRSGTTGVDDHTDVTTNESIFWKLRIPATQEAGTYAGSNTFTSALGSVCSTGDDN